MYKVNAISQAACKASGAPCAKRLPSPRRKPQAPRQWCAVAHPHMQPLHAPTATTCLESHSSTTRATERRRRRSGRHDGEALSRVCWITASCLPSQLTTSPEGSQHRHGSDLQRDGSTCTPPARLPLAAIRGVLTEPPARPGMTESPARSPRWRSLRQRSQMWHERRFRLAAWPALPRPPLQPRASP